MTLSVDLTILRFLAGRTNPTAPEVGIACRFTAAVLRAGVVHLAIVSLVARTTINHLLTTVNGL